MSLSTWLSTKPSASTSPSPTPQSRPKTSGIWVYAADLTDGAPPLGRTAGKIGVPVFRCSACAAKGIKIPREYLVVGGNAHFREHLLKDHGIVAPTSSDIASESAAATSQRIIDMTGWKQGVRVAKRARGPTVSTIGMNAGALRAVYLNWIVVDSLPFHLAKSPTFRAFLDFVNPMANSLLPRSGNTIRQDLAAAVRLRRPGIQQTIRDARSKIHLVFDGWTSANGYGLLGVQCRFLDRDYHLQAFLIGLRRITGEHSGSALAELLFEVTEAYRCTESIGFVVSDNASNMDTLVFEIERQMTAVGIVWPADYYRIRCLGHIVHLVAEAFLLEGADTPDAEDRDIWRSFGCFGKVHNIVVWVQGSPQRKERFRELSELQLVRDNKTRWHSYYDMCHRALQVKDALAALCASEVELEADALLPSDWVYLTNLTQFLKPFRVATKANEGLFDTVDRMLPGLEFLLDHLEQSRVIYADNPYISHRIDCAWQKLIKYYNKTDDTLAYMAATVLNPIHKWQWFETRWIEGPLLDWLRKGKRHLRDLWTNCYADPTNIQEVRPNIVATNSDDAFAAFLYQQEGPILDELELYLIEPRLAFTDSTTAAAFRPLSWWTDLAQRDRFPRLSKLAWDLLTIPVMSAEIERIFSECALALGDQRHRLISETLEEQMLLKSWLRNATKKQDQKVSFLLL